MRNVTDRPQLRPAASEREGARPIGAVTGSLGGVTPCRAQELDTRRPNDGREGRVPYPGRKVHHVLPEFAGTNVVRPTTQQRAQLVAFVAREYKAGRSLRELAELTGRTQTAVRRALDECGIQRRGRGAPTLSAD
ncbi:helix-turn-helix domain-containing protein [Geodermatophilus sp. SYSU D01186]